MCMLISKLIVRTGPYTKVLPEYSFLFKCTISGGEAQVLVYIMAQCFHVQLPWAGHRGGLGQNVRPGNLTLIQAIPYTHNKFWNMDNPISLFVWPAHKRSKSLVGAVEKNIIYSLLNSIFTSLFSNISVTPFFLVPVTSSPSGLLLLT